LQSLSATKNRENNNAMSGKAQELKSYTRTRIHKYLHTYQLHQSLTVSDAMKREAAKRKDKEGEVFIDTRRKLKYFT